MRRLLLDFGGVVIKTPFELLDTVGSPPWHGPFAPASDTLWQALAAGTITERRYWDLRAAELFDAPDPVARLMDVLFDRPPGDLVRPEVAALLDAVERPALLTNDLTRFHSPAWVERMTVVLNRFDPLIDLSHGPSLKPHPAAFALAVERLACPAGEVVFVDDQPSNVAGARAAGLESLHFDVTDPAGSVGRIREALE